MKADSQQWHSVLSRYIKKLIERTKLPVNCETVIDVLCKIELQDNLPKFDDIESRLAMDNIPSFYDVGEAGYDDLLRAAKALIHKMFEAGSLQHVSAKQMYFALCSNPAQTQTLATIDGKRVTKESVEKILK